MITAFGPAHAIPMPRPGPGVEVIDASRHIGTPGLVKTHRRQSLTRGLVAAQDTEWFDWLRALDPR